MVQVTINETAINSIACIEHDVDWLTIASDSGVYVDETAMADALGDIVGIDQIRILKVSITSMVRNLLFLKAFPKLEHLILYGKHLQSLDGLQLIEGDFALKIDTGSNRTRNIAEIANARVARLNLNKATGNDLFVIGRSLTIRHLLLGSCPPLNLDCWHSVPIDSLQIYNGTITELSDTSAVNTLRSLTCYGCRKLERFKGDNSNVRWLIIEQCNALDLKTLSTFSCIEFLTLVTLRNNIPLSVFTNLSQLKVLALIDCNVTVDIGPLKPYFNRLEVLHLSKAKKDQLIALSETNPDIIIRNNRFSYKDGMAVDIT